MIPNMVSIVMPVYNGARYVRSAVESVINQTYSAWELIVINDGSTDTTEAIVKEIQDPRIKYFFQKNQGVSSARNAGILRAAGEFLCCLDADDELPPQSLASRLNIFQTSDEVRFVDGIVKIYDESMTKHVRSWSPNFKGRPLRQLVRLTGKCFFGPTWLIRREPECKYRYDEELKYCEDLYFYISIGSKGDYAYTKECIYHYRQNPTSAMNNLDGLANGYSQLYARVRNHSGEILFIDRIIHWLKSRKIMFLSFSHIGEYRKAFKFLLSGRI